MILVDTSIWIEFFKGHPPYSPQLHQEMERQNVLAVEPVFGELLQGAKDQRERTVLLEYWCNLPHVEEKDLWLKAGEISAMENFFSKGVGLIDAFLVAVARKYQTKIWSLDQKLQSVLTPREIY